MSKFPMSVFNPPPIDTLFLPNLNSFLFSFIEFKGSKKNNCMFNLDFEEVVSFKFKLTLGELKSSFA